jgi:predicted ATP-grasp superfamily ATP-dependent carboligase
VFRIIITEANTKNSIALQRELSRSKQYFIIGIDNKRLLYSRLYNYCNEFFYGEITEAVKKYNPDFIIPVGAHSVNICSRLFQNLCFISSKQNIDFAFDKENLSMLNKLINVNYPITNLLKSIDDVNLFVSKFPCVVKSNKENQIKFDSIYVNQSNLDSRVINKINILLNQKSELIIQQQVFGKARGFFCIAKNGVPVIYYMHERIREYPISGGASTAAVSIFCNSLLEISKSIIHHLNWNGPLMIEFKYDVNLNRYYLIELNPKFWGSLDLSYAIGLNFGQTLVDLFLKRDVGINNYEYKVDVRFYWILDGDLLNIIKSKKIIHFFDYFKPGAKNSISKNLIIDCIKLIWTLKKILH